MSTNNSAAQRLAFVAGENVRAIDAVSEQQANVANIGAAIAAAQGTLNALPQSVMNPLSVATPGGMGITVGGANQTVLCNGWYCDYCGPAQSYTVPAAPASGTRKDLIAIQENVLGVVLGTVSRQVESAPGTFASQNINIVASGVNFQYVSGDGTGNLPATPSGWQAFASVTVPTGTTVIASSNIAYLFPTMNPTGAAGSVGPIGPPGNSVTPMGLWAIGTTYAVNNIVTYSGSSYIAVAASTGITPGTDSSKWMLLAGPGPQGAQGNPGQPGTPGTPGGQGPAGPSPNWRGAWSSSTAYNALDVVSFGGGSYLAVLASTGITPGTDGTRWGQLAAPGSAGQAGASPNVRGPWSSSTAYNALDIVGYGGSGYIANVGSTNVTPGTDSSKWTLIAAAGANGTNGTNGTNGVNGTNGTNGAPGAPGPSANTTTTAAVTMPAIGAGVSVPVVNAAAFPFGTYCILSDGTNAFYGQVTAGGNPLTVEALAYIAPINGGTTVASGASLTFSGAPAAPLISSAMQYIDSSATGTVTMPTLPGASSQGYKLRALMTLNCNNTNSTITGTISGGGASWTSSPRAGYSSANGSATSVLTVALIGTAVGGQTPTVSWSNSAVGNGHIEVIATPH